MTDFTILGFDIGGTKTTAVLGTLDGQVLDRLEFPTPASEPFEVAFEMMAAAGDQLVVKNQLKDDRKPTAVSVAVGGPLDIEQGLIYSPPHLPTWDRAPLKRRLAEHFKLPVFIEHDGNAGALAEFYFGAGKGTRNMIFLTMGTGLGAGIILDGRVYHGTTDAAGEVGHIRIAEGGPEEYGKEGSWEGYCSGSGLVKLARMRAPEVWSEDVTTRQIIERALKGDPDAGRLIVEMADWFGKGLALLVDILNPEMIVIGTLGVLLGDLLLEPARAALRREALPTSSAACRVVPAQLGSKLGSLSALIAAIDYYKHH